MAYGKLSEGWKKAKFAERFSAAPSWDNWASDAEHERIIMVSEFHTWALKKRHEVESRLISGRATLIDLSPFARAGLDKADSPADIPLVVVEFVYQQLDIMKYERQLDLLNLYYESQARQGHEVFLGIDPENKAEFNDLWEWFIEERDEQEAEAKRKAQEKREATLAAKKREQARQTQRADLLRRRREMLKDPNRSDEEKASLKESWREAELDRKRKARRHARA